ncbi:Na+/H+ antiporter subunit E [Stutzerimonas urumqiensis]|uniref:Na+/H+ antiporter subunit E n=1 Tax=Stutzerimonas urumqiensis TaxID=638269 RepID=UPI0015AEF127|nr:Na+/H+ antiporter subunit E [Stutzerimonas urumqiensis]
MMARLLPHPALSVVLLLLWLLLNNTLNPGHILLGGALGVIIPACMRNFVMPVPKVKQRIGLMRFTVRVLVDIVMANFHVAKLVLGPTRRLSPAFVEIPVSITDDFVLTVLTSVVSLTPGTVSADVSDDRRRILVHTLDAPDPDALVAEIKTRYEAPLLEIFECSTT